MLDWFLDIVLFKYDRKHRRAQVTDSNTSKTWKVKYNIQFRGLPRKVQAHLQRRFLESRSLGPADVQPLDDSANRFIVQGVSDQYMVNLEEATCCCPDFITHRSACKHIFTVLRTQDKTISSLGDRFTNCPWLTVDTSSVFDGARRRIREQVKPPWIPVTIC